MTALFSCLLYLAIRRVGLWSCQVTRPDVQTGLANRKGDGLQRPMKHRSEGQGREPCLRMVPQARKEGLAPMVASRFDVSGLQGITMGINRWGLTASAASQG